MRRQTILRTTLSLVLLASPFAAQSIEDPGPHPVGNASFTNAAVFGTVYYPALTAGALATPDPSGGPYPLVGFMHGFVLQPSNYDDLCTHLASWGFVVLSIGTETGFQATMKREARETKVLMKALFQQSQTSTSIYAGMIDGNEWAAVGHSMGGGALFHLIGFEPNVRIIVPLQPYRGPAFGGSAALSNVTGYTGDLLTIGGEADQVAPTATMALTYHQDAQTAARANFIEVTGMGHLGSTDAPNTNEPLSAQEQARMHRLYVTGFLRAEMRSEEDLYVELVGEGSQVEPLSQLEMVCPDPVHWSAESVTPSALAIGVGGENGELALLLVSLQPASINTVFGVLGVRPGPLFGILSNTTLGTDGLQEVIAQVPANFSGLTIYTQALTLIGSTGTLTRTASYLVP